MKELITRIAQALVDNPDQVLVSEIEGNQTSVLELKVATVVLDALKDTEAEVVCQLSHARAVIEAAIRGLAPRNWTHIDAGLRTALAELQSPRHLERNIPVMILLTDGVQTGTRGEEVRAAAEVRAAGVRGIVDGRRAQHRAGGPPGQRAQSQL